MALPKRKLLRLRQGNTRRVAIRAYSTRKRTTALPIDDRTWSLVVKTGIGGSTLLTATTDATSAVDGLVYLVLTDEQTAAATAGDDYVYELDMTDAEGDTYTLAAGPCVLEAQP